MTGVGTLSVASASIKNVPFRAEHGGLVALDIRDDYLRLGFPHYAARRRYVAFNRGKKPAKVTDKKR